MIINITPVAKPRMTRSDKWKKRPCVLRYRAFCNEINLKYRAPLPERVCLEFIIAMPKSWSKKKKAEMNYMPHKARPDVDNMVKSVFDALCEDDSHIWLVKATKRWGYNGSIEINTIF